MNNQAQRMKTLLPAWTALPAFILLGTLVAPAFATTWYVSTSGNDKNPGTFAQPWRTIQHAAGSTSVQAGDTVIIADGNYGEDVNIRRAGTAASPVTFRSQNPLGASTRTFAISASYVRVQDFEVSTNGANGTTVSVGGATTGVHVVGNYVHDCGGIGIFVRGRHTYVARNHIYHVDEELWMSGSDYVVENNNVERPYYSGYLGDADYTRFFGDDGMIRNNWLHGARRSEIGPAHLDGFQTYTDSGNHAHNITIDGNIVQSFAECAIIQYGANVSNNVFRNNVCIGDSNVHTNWGVIVNGPPGPSGIQIYNNVFYATGWAGVTFQSGASGSIWNNIFVGEMDNAYQGVYGDANTGYNLTFNTPKPRTTNNTDLYNHNPLFLNPASAVGADGQPFTNDDGFTLQIGSPAIDAGMVIISFDKDILGTSRPRGAGWDIGAYEFSPTTSGSAAPPLPPTDVTAKVN